MPSSISNYYPSSRGRSVSEVRGPRLKMTPSEASLAWKWTTSSLLAQHHQQAHQDDDSHSDPLASLVICGKYVGLIATHRATPIRRYVDVFYLAVLIIHTGHIPKRPTTSQSKLAHFQPHLQKMVPWQLASCSDDALSISSIYGSCFSIVLVM